MAPNSRLLTALLLAALTLAGCDWNPWRPEPDRTAPQVTLAAPAGGATLRDDSVRVTGTARDSAGAVTRVTYTRGPGPEREVPITPGREVEFAFTVTGLVAGSNTLTVHAEDGRGNRGSQAVTVTYQPNRPPVAADDTATTWADSAVVIQVLANDTDPDGDSLRVSLVTQPALGTAVLGANGTVTYTPRETSEGVDTLRYRVTDSRGDSATARLTVRVRGLPPRYTVTEMTLPALPAANNPVLGIRYGSWRINDQGHVVLRRDTDYQTGFLPSYRETMTEHIVWEAGRSRVFFLSGWYPGIFLSTPPQSHSLYDLNNRGEVLHSVCARTGGGNIRFCVSYAYAVRDLATGTTWVVMDTTRYPVPAAALNDAGQVLVPSDVHGPGPSLWTGATRTQLPAASGTAWVATALTNGGDATGYTVENPSSMVVWRGGALTRVPMAQSARGTDMNESGQVVGVSGTWGAESTPFLWENGQVVPLHPGGTTATMPRINDRGDVIATGSPGGPYLWRSGRRFPLDSQLATAGWTLLQVYAISNTGQIVGMGRRTGAADTAFVVLTPRR